MSRADLVRSGDRFSRTLSFLEEHDLLDRLSDWATEEGQVPTGNGPMSSRDRCRKVAAEILTDLCAALDIEIYPHHANTNTTGGQA